MEYIILNGMVVIIGCLISDFIKRFLSDNLINAMLKIANLSIVIIGIQGAIQTKNTILLLISAVVGGLIGTLLNIDKGFEKLGEKMKKFFKSSDQKFVDGMILLLMITCIGSLAIIGPLNVGLKNDPSLLIYKSVLDFITAIIYGSLYGKGTLLAGFGIIIYEGLIYLFANVVAPVLTPDIIVELSAVGSLLVVALGLKLLNILEIKVANYLPSLLIVVLYYLIKNLF